MAMFGAVLIIGTIIRRLTYPTQNKRVGDEAWMSALQKRNIKRNWIVRKTLDVEKALRYGLFAGHRIPAAAEVALTKRTHCTRWLAQIRRFIPVDGRKVIPIHRRFIPANHQTIWLNQWVRNISSIERTYRLRRKFPRGSDFLSDWIINLHFFWLSYFSKKAGWIQKIHRRFPTFLR